MAENKMAEVAAMFGKKLGEPFEVGICGELKSKRHKCKLTEGGLYEWYEDWQKWVFDPEDILHDLLTGEAEIVEDEK